MGMSVMEPKAKEKYLNQVLDFVNEDLEALPFSEKLAWAARFYFQDEGFFARKDIKRKSNYEEKIKDLSLLQGLLRHQINWLITAKAGTTVTVPPIIRFLQAGEDCFSIQYGYLPREEIFEGLQVHHHPDDLLVSLQFNEALDGLPRKALKKCPECGKFFAHLSKKEKNYCSPKCGFKFLSRKRRDELKKDPKKYKAYLKKQRESMRKVYIEEKKKELGPNVAVRRNGKED